MVLPDRAIEILSKQHGSFTGYCGIVTEEIQDDECSVSCSLRPELLNPAGVAHGGFIATLTDVAAGIMALQADQWKHDIVTQSCNLHYLRAGTGERLRAKSRVVRKGHRVCVVQVECFNDDDQLCVTAIYELAYLDVR